MADPWRTQSEVSVVPSRDASAQPDGDFVATLVRTLQIHHQLGCEVASTASVLGIHTSTARYRLYRIDDLTGLDPADPRSLHALLGIAGL